MEIIKSQNLICPIDGELLSNNKTQLHCKNGHSFDIARQGHINLLPVQHKRSKEPGDSKEMVQARKFFLNQGHYESIASKLTEIISSLILKIKPDNICLLDAGCGEGYYLDYILNNLFSQKKSTALSIIGLDISRYAILEAAKRTKQISWVVGTNRLPPVKNQSVDIISCVFGFHHFDGFNTILRNDGYIILVEPGPDHLKELREIIYKNVKKTDPTNSTNLSNFLKKGFSIITTEQLQYKTADIKNETINQLLLMTPHFFRANKSGQEAASRQTKINLTVDIIFRVLKK